MRRVGFPFLFSVTETVLHLEIKDFSLCGLGFWLSLLLPWIARRSNQSILKEINPENSLEGLVLKLRHTLTSWCEDPTHWKRSWCWERLRAGGEGGDRERDGWMTSSTQWTWVWANSERWWRTGKPGVLQSMELQRIWHDWATEQQASHGVRKKWGLGYNTKQKVWATVDPWSRKITHAVELSLCSRAWELQLLKPERLELPTLHSKRVVPAHHN